MEKDKIKEKVNDVLNDVFGIEYSEIKDDAVLKDDLDIDSLDALYLVMELEHEFGISIPDEKLTGFEGCTVKDVYDLVDGLL